MCNGIMSVLLYEAILPTRISVVCFGASSIADRCLRHAYVRYRGSRENYPRGTAMRNASSSEPGTCLSIDSFHCHSCNVIAFVRFFLAFLR